MTYRHEQTNKGWQSWVQSLTPNIADYEPLHACNFQDFKFVFLF